MSIKDELESRAKYKKGDRVMWNGQVHIVSLRFWRRTEDAFYYDLQDIPVHGFFQRNVRKVPEGDLSPT